MILVAFIIYYTKVHLGWRQVMLDFCSWYVDGVWNGLSKQGCQLA